MCHSPFVTGCARNDGHCQDIFKLSVNGWSGTSATVLAADRRPDRGNVVIIAVDLSVPTMRFVGNGYKGFESQVTPPKCVQISGRCVRGPC
jgi:hypothetical protein